MVLAGFKLLAPLRLGNQPDLNDPDRAKDLVNTWTLAFIASGQAEAEEDFRRSMEAFAKYLPTAQFWPRPAEILALLPGRARLKEPAGMPEWMRELRDMPEAQRNMPEAQRRENQQRVLRLVHDASRMGK